VYVVAAKKSTFTMFTFDAAPGDICGRRFAIASTSRSWMSK